jgi:type I site-specific restriction endonuclease
MKFKMEITTSAGTFIVEREFTTPMEQGGVFAILGQKVVTADAEVIEARQVLDVLPTLITAINNEFAATAASKTSAELNADEKTRAEAQAHVAQIVKNGVQRGTARSEIARGVRVWCADHSLPVLPLREIINMITDEQKAWDAEVKAKMDAVNEDVATVNKAMKSATEVPLTGGPEVLTGDGSGEALPAIEQPSCPE